MEPVGPHTVDERGGMGGLDVCGPTRCAGVCPCPLVVTEEFMREHGIDLVVHGFADDADAKRREEFFAAPMKAGRFQRIPYYEGQSTSAIIERIRTMDG